MSGVLICAGCTVGGALAGLALGLHEAGKEPGDDFGFGLVMMGGWRMFQGAGLGLVAGVVLGLTVGS